MSMINFNMGCIETYRIHTVVIQLLLINFNMGCIETCQCHNHSPFDTRLTLTWDVLKPDRFSKGKIS